MTFELGDVQKDVGRIRRRGGPVLPNDSEVMDMSAINSGLGMVLKKVFRKSFTLTACSSLILEKNSRYGLFFFLGPKEKGESAIPLPVNLERHIWGFLVFLSLFPEEAIPRENKGRCTSKEGEAEMVQKVNKKAKDLGGKGRKNTHLRECTVRGKC